MQSSSNVGQHLGHHMLESQQGSHHVRWETCMQRLAARHRLRRGHSRPKAFLLGMWRVVSRSSSVSSSRESSRLSCRIIQKLGRRSLMQPVFLTDIRTSLKDYVEDFTWIYLMLDARKCQITKNLLLHINKSSISLYKLRLRKEDISVPSRQMNWNVSSAPSNPPLFQLYPNQDAQDVIASFRITLFPTSLRQDSQMRQSTPTSIQTISLALGERFTFLLLQSAVCHQDRNLPLEMYRKHTVRFPFMHRNGQEPLFGSRTNYFALIHACASDYDHQLELTEALRTRALIFFAQMALDRHQDGSMITYFFTFLENILRLTMNRGNYGTKRSLRRGNIKTKEEYGLVGTCLRMGPWRN